MTIAVGIATIAGGVALIIWQYLSSKKSHSKTTEKELDPIVSPRQFRLRFTVGFLVILLGVSLLVYSWKTSALMGAWCLFVAVSLALIIVTLVVLDMTWSLKHISKHLKSFEATKKELQQAYLDAKRRQKGQQGNGKP